MGNAAADDDDDGHAGERADESAVGSGCELAWASRASAGSRLGSHGD